MDDADALTVVVQEMSKAFPSLMETLIVERDKSVPFSSFGFLYSNYGNFLDISMLVLFYFCYFFLFSALKYRYMSQALLRVARDNSSVVAVVGKGHLSGIKKNWMQPIEVICS